MDDKAKEKVQSNRRKLMKTAMGVGASSLVVPGLAAASNDSESTTSTEDESSGSSKKMTRAEKAAQNGVDWNPNWVNENRINETWVEGETSTSDESRDFTSSGATTQKTRSGSRTFGIKGINVTVEWSFGPCEGWVEMRAFGQSERNTLTCSDVCKSYHLDGGAAYVDLDVCYNWDTDTLEVTAEGCIWEVSSWSCGSHKYTF